MHVTNNGEPTIATHQTHHTTNGIISKVDPQKYPGRGRHQRLTPAVEGSTDTTQDDTMQLDDDPVQNSIQRVLRLAPQAPAPQQPHGVCMERSMRRKG